MITMNDNNWTPKYERVKNHIKGKIADGEYVVDAIIPSENRLPKLLGVSKQTVIKAIGDLVNDGVLRREQGKGTFVNGLPDDTPSVGIVLSSAGAGRFFSAIVESAVSALDAANCRHAIKFSGNDPLKERRNLNELIQSGEKGILLAICHPTRSRENVEFLLERKIPFVLIDKYVPEVEADYVVFDNFEIGRLATEHLIALGHKRIAFVMAREHEFSSITGILAGYRDALARNNLETDRYVLTRPDSSDLVDATEALLMADNPPTALVSLYSDPVDAALERRRLTAPDDVSIVKIGNYGDTFSASTRVDPRIGEMINAAIDILTAKISDSPVSNAGKRQIKIAPALIVGKSSAPPRSS